MNAMALSATVYRLKVELSDVDRNVYQALDLRVARHPSETMRYMLTRTLAYALCFEEGIAFSKGGLSDTDVPALAVHDLTGRLLAWIEVGSPSAERMHRATKAAERVKLFSYAEPALLRKEFASRVVHRLEDIEAYHVDPRFLDDLEPHIERNTDLGLTRNEGQLYVTAGSTTLESRLEVLTLTL